MTQFFVNTGDGIEVVNSRDEAIKLAQEAIDGWRDCCDPGWPEEVANVFWGEIHSTATADDRGDDCVEYVLSESPAEWRCNICGGLVKFDGTKPASGNLPGPGRPCNSATIKDD